MMKPKNSASGMFRETGPILVQRDYGARPNKPDIVQTRCRWIIGDVTEVLDHNTWKLGKIAKIVENNYFVIRLADCIQLKEFHISSLRVPVPQDPPTATVHCKQFPAADKANRRGKQLPADVLRRSGKKRKSSAVLDSPPQPRQRRFMPQHQSAPGAEQHRYAHAREETAECSVASCSANDDVAYGGVGSSRLQCCSVGRGDAMSVVAAPCTSSSSDDDGVLSDGPAMDVHELELEAYRSTVRALHASGPLTWEQESLLTNLRLSLNISNEEHLLQLRHLLSS
ncbi:hypothetical protein QYE76_061194 [Lolium multiflorum]|uniref:ENT domain-containing protein n=1 Tax=Lolium multiflorum TaxID=4521 RepID=A0AAD8S162_LOLMU|nr:hypothetical protein QYE76_061194 [Lolium multiflorum]